MDFDGYHCVVRVQLDAVYLPGVQTVSVIGRLTMLIWECWTTRRRRLYVSKDLSILECMKRLGHHLKLKRFITLEKIKLDIVTPHSPCAGFAIISPKLRCNKNPPLGTYGIGQHFVLMIVGIHQHDVLAPS